MGDLDVRDPGAYVIRSIARALDGRVHYVVCDLAGNVSRVTLPHALTVTEWADPVIRYHVVRHAARIGLG